MKVEKEIINELIHLWKKPDVNKQARAKFLKKLLEESKMSQREFCDAFDLKKSTLTGWLVYDKISEEEYTELRKQIPERIIHNSLKSHALPSDKVIAQIREDNKMILARDIVKENKEAINNINAKTDLDKCLIYSISLLRKHSKQIYPSNDSIMLCVELRDLVNVIKMRIEKNTGGI